MKKQFLLMTLLLAFTGFSMQGLGCQASFTWSADTSGGIQFTNTSTGVVAVGAQWSFGDGTGSSWTNPYHQYNSTSWYIVCLTVWDSVNCQSTFCDTVMAAGQSTNCVA